MKIRVAYLLGAMTAFQLMFLSVVAFTGTAPDQVKLASVTIFTLLMGVGVILLPHRVESALAVMSASLSRNDKYAVSIMSTLVLLVGILYAVNLRPVFDEESILAASRMIVAEGGLDSFFENYKKIPWLGFQHPPLVPMLYGLAMRFFGTDLFVLRIVSVCFTLGTVVTTFLLGSELYGRETGFAAALFLTTFTYVFRVGAAASNDMPVTFFFALVMFLVSLLIRRPSHFMGALVGVSIGLGLLTKYTMLLCLPVLFGYWLTNSSFRKVTRYLLAVVFGLAVASAAWFVYASKAGILDVQGNRLVSYLGTVTNTRNGFRAMLEWVVARLPSAIGPYNIPVISWGFIQIARLKDHPANLLIIWISVIFFFLTATLPDTRYFLPMFPPLAIVMARGISLTAISPEKPILLALLLCSSALVLFVDWHRTVPIFLR